MASLLEHACMYRPPLHTLTTRVMPCGCGTRSYYPCAYIRRRRGSAFDGPARRARAPAVRARTAATRTIEVVPARRRATLRAARCWPVYDHADSLENRSRGFELRSSNFKSPWPRIRESEKERQGNS
jgi:hypothetical protein